MKIFIRHGLLAAAWLAAAGAPAQPTSAESAASAASAADPLQAGADVPPIVYASPLARYRAAGDAQVGSWTQANETVARIGGWRAYAREASQPEAAAVAAPVPAPAPSAASSPAAPGPGRP